MPSKSFKDDTFAETYIRPFVREVPLQLFPFRGYTAGLPHTPLSLYYFLQPNLTNYVETMYDTSSQTLLTMENA
jgi:hypothetical protein